jgi:hypothetical protein
MSDDIPTFITSCEEGSVMARNTGKNTRKGSVKDRTQFQGPNGEWIKRDAESGKFMDVKEDEKPFKGVAKEDDDRRK